MSDVSTWDWQRIKNELLLQRRLLLVGIAVVLGMVLSLVFGAWPLWKNVEATRDTLDREQQQLQKVQQRVALVTGITDEDRKNFAIAAETLPNEKEPLRFLQALQILSGKSGVSLTQYDLNPGVISTESAVASSGRRSANSAAQRTSARNMPITVEFTGKFADIISLVSSIESARPILEVEDLTLDPVRRGRTTTVSTSSGDLQYVARMGLRTYYFPISISSLENAVAVALSKEQQATLLQIIELAPWFPPGSQDVSSSGSNPTQGEFRNTDLFGVQPQQVVVPSPQPEPDSLPVNDGLN